MAAELGWLIERNLGGVVPTYIQIDGGFGLYWGPDHETAVRFSRRVDAEKALGVFREREPHLFPASMLPHIKAVEHGWS